MSGNNKDSIDITNFQDIESKWQKKWVNAGTFEFDVHKKREKFYVLTMFPYPSGDKLHMGHWYQYGLVDSWARFQKMRGRELFQPMGFDAFGLPAENFAIKSGIHPDTSTTKNVAIMMEQFRRMGVGYSWKYNLNTSKPDYYRWTQWLFLEFYKRGLVYKAEAPVNWCKSCQTVLANEQVKDGGCERCGTTVSKKNLNQWFFKITAYAQKLLDGIDSLNWPHKTKAMQKNWIGRSDGTQIKFNIAECGEAFEVFTTRPDTLFGVTYVTLAPEHPLVPKITTPEQRGAIEAYIADVAGESEIERLSATREKTGVFTGAYAINPLNGEKVPIWISDYVLYTYGTGSVMAVPGHDERDFEFAKKFALPIRKVILEEGTRKDSELESAYTGAGKMINSGEFDGVDNDKGKELITKALAEKEIGRATVTYRLRDWLISRQRYWGCPIPIVYCDKCGEIPLPKEQLPLKLPSDIAFKPTGESPLASNDSFVNTSCPKCSGPATREVDTLDTFVCSSWYFLRFPNVGNDKEAFEKQLTDKMLPVDQYIGGPEHACMHLLYARFFTHALKDMGYISFKEPFPNLVHQGLILGPDHQKMSKSRGNTVSPDDYVAEHGADVLRMYLCFGFNYIDGGPWEDGGFIAITRYVEKLQKLFNANLDLIATDSIKPKAYSNEDKKLLFVFHDAIKRMTHDIDRFMFNTSMARLMELYNALSDYLKKVPKKEQNLGMLKDILIKYIQILAPFAPHKAEELWEACGNEGSIFNSTWPEFDPKFLTLDVITMAVMVNGRLRGEIEVAADSSQDDVIAAAEQADKVAKHLVGMRVIKTIYVKGKMVNMVVKPE